MASLIKRHRATKAQVEERREALLAIIENGRPMTVRQVFYQATVRGLVEKAETGYAKVQTDLDDDAPGRGAALRLARRQHPLAAQAAHVRQRRGRAQRHRQVLPQEPVGRRRCYVEVWLEKDALSGVIYPVTSMYDVPLMVARGYASLSFLHAAAEYIAALDVPACIYHLGDFDPSGVNAGEKIEETLRELAPGRRNQFRTTCRHPRTDRRMESPNSTDQKSPTPGPRVLAISVLSLTRSTPMTCATSCGWRSSNTCQSINSRSSRPPRRASAH